MDEHTTDLANAILPKAPGRFDLPSHRYAFLISGLMTFVLVLTLAATLEGREKDSRDLAWMVGSTLPGPVCLCALLFGGRARWVYYLVGIVIALLTLRLSYNSVRFLDRYLSGRPVIVRHHNLKSEDQPFVARQRLSTARIFLVPFMAILLGLLFWRFMFGRPSRAYFGFVAGTGSNPTPMRSSIPPAVKSVA